MTIFQQMADKCLEEQADFYNLHEEIIRAFRGYGQETHYFSKILNKSTFNKVQTALWYLNEEKDQALNKLLLLK